METQNSPETPDLIKFYAFFLQSLFLFPLVFVHLRSIFVKPPSFQDFTNISNLAFDSQKQRVNVSANFHPAYFAWKTDKVSQFCLHLTKESSFKSKQWFLFKRNPCWENLEDYNHMVIEQGKLRCHLHNYNSCLFNLS